MHARFPTLIFQDGVVVTDDSRCGRHCALFQGVYLSGTSLGDYSYIQAGSVSSNADIGPFCSIGPGVSIGLSAHPTTMLSTSPVFYDPRQPLPEFLTDRVRFEASASRTEIGADVWIGQGALLKAGVRIGVGAVVGAGAVVTRNVESYQIVAGNPARFIRARFPADLAAALVASRWWERNAVTLRGLAASYGDPAAFLTALERVQ
jgi:acetyltransferase-like isoleucine patch superfamily enzyme